MSTIELLRVIDDEHRRAVRRAELIRLAQGGRVHRRTFGQRVSRWLGGARRS
jgi:hypothetical protein